MASMEHYADIGFIPTEESFVACIATMDGDEYVRCNRCGFGGCDIRVSSCGCTLHAVRRTCTGFYAVEGAFFSVRSRRSRSEALSSLNACCDVQCCIELSALNELYIAIYCMLPGCFQHQSVRVFTLECSPIGL